VIRIIKYLKTYRLLSQIVIYSKNFELSLKFFFDSNFIGLQ